MSRKGFHLSEEAKQRISESHKKPWEELSLRMKCKRLKISQNTFLKYSNGDTSYEYMSKWAEERHKMSKSDCHKGIYNGNFGKPMSAETLSKLKESLAKRSRNHFNEISKIESEGKYLTSETLSNRIGCGKTTFERFYRNQEAFNIGRRHLFDAHIADSSPLIGLKAKGVSHYENEIADYILSISSFNVVKNRRNVITPYELDIYVPEKKLAIEYNGLYWHSNIDKNYHLNKTIQCENKGIRLMHIFEDEWRDKKEIVKSMIKSALGLYDHKYMARKLNVVEVPKSIGIAFFEQNHIHGSSKQDFAFYGLMNKGNLVQVISIRKNFANKSKGYELGRMCSLLNNQVVGGFSKLIKYALNDLGISEIESYVDRRLFTANGYYNTGWKLISISGPSYSYTDGKDRFNRQKYMKKTCLNRWPDLDITMTEQQMCEAKGLHRIYDCGCFKLKYSI